MIGGSPRMGVPLGLPLTLALSPQAGRGDPGGACGTRPVPAALTIRKGWLAFHSGIL
jgi:hypothetical protein